MKPYYQDGAVTIYHGDFLEILPGLPTCDAIITDPPYGETSLEWDVWPKEWPQMCLQKTRQLWCFGSARMFWDQRDDFTGWKFAQDVVWEKHNGSGFAVDRFRRVHETAFHFYSGEWADLYHEPPLFQGVGQKYSRKSQPPHTGKIGGHTDTEKRTERIQRSVILVDSCHGYATNETQKPEGIVAPLVEYSVAPGGLVIDLFAGSGTTLAVAKLQGKKAIGIEKRESQCEDAARRLSQEVLAL